MNPHIFPETETLEKTAAWMVEEVFAFSSTARHEDHLGSELLRLRDKIAGMYGVEELKDVPLEDLPALIESLLGKVTALSVISGKVWFRPKLLAFMRGQQRKAS